MKKIKNAKLFIGCLFLKKMYNCTMIPVPPIYIPEVDSFPQPPIFNGPKEDKDESKR